MSETEPDGLQIRLLGELEVAAGGRVVRLPQSKKTRALLGYLVLTGRAHRREKLCELLWDVADDPRAALRWSLSKLREIVDHPDVTRLVASREHVAVEPRSAHVDASEVKRLVGGSPDQAPTANLEEARALFRGELLEGLELPDFHGYDAWLLAERNAWRELRRKVVTTLLARVGGHPDKALPLVRELVDIDPSDGNSRAQLLELLHATGRIREAEEQSRTYRRLLGEPPPSDAPGTPPSTRGPATCSAGGASRYVGRVAERARLVEWCAAAHTGARLLLLGGDAGMGKTRLIQELARERAGPATRVALARAPETRIGWPYAPFRELVAAAYRPERDGDLRSALGPLLPDGGAAVPGPSGKEALFRAATLVIERAARDGAPLVLLMDDAHWLDDASAELLHFAVLGLRRAPVRFVLAAREGELRDRRSVALALRGLSREQLVDELHLLPLDRDETLELVGAALPEAVRATICEQSAGNPLFALELSRERRLGETTSPGSLSRLVRDRLEALSPEESDVLGWAAVLGSHFDPKLLGQLVAMGEDALVETLERLVRHRWLELSAAPQGSVATAFTHELVRRGVYEHLSEPRRRLMHGRVARALAARTDPDGAIALAVAHHALQGGDAAMAARACLHAGQRCLSSYAHAEAFRLARQGLAYAAALSDPERTTLSLELIEMSCAAKRPESPGELLETLQGLCSRAVDLGALDHARAGFYTQASILWEHDDLASARGHMREVERLCRLGTAAERIAALSDAARCLAVLDQSHHRAEAFLLEAEALGAGGDTVAAPAPFHVARGLLSLHLGDYGAARAALDTAAEIALRTGDRIEQYYTLEFRIDLELARGDHAAALSFAEELLPIAARLRSGSEAPFAAALHALARYAAGVDATPEPFDAAIAEFAREDAKRRSAILLSRAAEYEAASGAWDAAARHAAEALRLAQLMDCAGEMAIAHGVLAQVESRTSGRVSPGRRAALEVLLGKPLPARARRLAQLSLAGGAEPPALPGKDAPIGTGHRRASVR